MDTHRAMFRAYGLDACLPWANGTAQNLQTYWLYMVTCAPPPNRLRYLIPHRSPPLARLPPVGIGVNDGADASEIAGVPSGFVCVPHPWTFSQCSKLLHLPRIARAMQIVIQLHRLTGSYQLVCILSAVWSCRRHRICR